ncbi:MAG: TonB family protein [Sulfuricaulis sp.]
MPEIVKFLIAVVLVSTSFWVQAQGLETDPTQRITIDDKGLRHIVLGRETGFNVYSAYAEAVRMKLKRVGDLQLPANLKSTVWKPLRLVADIAIKADGSLHSVTILKSSGNADFDESAVRAVNQAAPFASFPETMAKQVDVVHVSGMWWYR